MASSKEYLEFILGQLSELEEITYRAMMGEFIIYYRGKIVGGIYDDRLLVKPVKAAISYMPTAPYARNHPILPPRLYDTFRDAAPPRRGVPHRGLRPHEGVDAVRDDAILSISCSVTTNASRIPAFCSCASILALSALSSFSENSTVL